VHLEAEIQPQRELQEDATNHAYSNDIENPVMGASARTRNNIQAAVRIYTHLEAKIS
jgi:hypothetical protein